MKIKAVRGRAMRMLFAGMALLMLLAPEGHVQAHPGHADVPGLRLWRDADGVFELEASFALQRDGKVQLIKHDGSAVWLALEKLSQADREWVRQRVASIAALNGVDQPTLITNDSIVNEKPSLTAAVVMSVVGIVVVVLAANITRKRWSNPMPAMAVAALLSLLGILALAQAAQEGVPGIQKHFEPFANKLKFRSDETYFYVESNGMPDHQMMVGIRAWQQQVPIPQAYAGRNAWSIPLHPKMAEKPVSAKTALFRGAIALAVNGVPIFNPIKNDGRTDTFTAGELDNFGGHCGKGDDYHYHIGPVHLEKIVGKGNPIGYALDGYPLYGYFDAAGKEPKNLDAFNGRIEKDGYRYYSTKKYPYVNGGLRGVVSVVDDQIDPQPRANPVRPEGRPLRGAKITGFSRDDERKQLKVTYDLAGKTQSMGYTAKDGGVYDFTFTDATGKVTTETYSGKGGDGKKGGGKKDGKGGKKDGDMNKKDGPMGKKDGDSQRLPWLGAHFDELDLNKDGYLTRTELKKEIDTTFAGFDRDKDDRLVRDEYEKGANVKSALAGFVKGHAEEMSDSKGMITRESMEGALFRMFDKSDKGKTGKISKADASRSGGGGKGKM